MKAGVWSGPNPFNYGDLPMKSLSLKWRVIIPIGIILVVGISALVAAVASRFAAAGPSLFREGRVL